MPTVLCPWDCSEFIHKTGQLPIDVVMARFLPKCIINIVTTSKKSSNVASCRDDFIREETDDYDRILLNPAWRVMPKIAFVTDFGPVVLTCRNHNGGTTRSYIYIYIYSAPTVS